MPTYQVRTEVIVKSEIVASHEGAAIDHHLNEIRDALKGGHDFHFHQTEVRTVDNGS